MSDFYRVDDAQTVDADFINGFLGDINLRLRGLEAQRQDLDAAIQGVNDLAIFRLNEVLTPAMQTLFDAQHLGFLSAPVAGDAVLGLGASTMTIAATRRHVFTPSPWVMLVREDNLDDYAGGRVQSYDQQTGELLVDITFVHGDAGTYEDVSVWGVAGGALSALESAEKTSEDRAAVAADAAQVALDRAYVEGVAADIEDGPVLSVNGENGTVTLGIDDIPNLTTTLAGKSETSHNHDAAYAGIGHNHNASYSALGHNHDASYSALAHNHDAAYPAIANALVKNATATISVGYTITPHSLGTKSSGWTVDPALGNYQYMTNGGAHTITAPASDCAVDILVTNNASAGALTMSGFTAPSGGGGDTYATTNTYKFLLMIRRINGVATYAWKALQ